MARRRHRTRPASTTSRSATRTARSSANALKRLVEANWPIGGATDHGVSEAIYLRDPDGNGIELYRDRAEPDWPRAEDGGLQMISEPLDLKALLSEAA